HLEADALLHGRRGVEADGDRHEGELQKPRPIRSGGGGHGKTPIISFYANGIAAALFRSKNRPAAPGVGQKMALPLDSDNPPMEARPVHDLPEGEHWRYEPKWDGFRCLAFRDGQNVELRSKSGQSLGRYFPDVAAALGTLKARQFVLDGEIIIPIERRLSFEALQLRLH